MRIGEFARFGAGLASLPLILASVSPAPAAEIAINGTSLIYDEAGDGPVVLFVHGAVSDHRAWAGFRDRVAQNHRFVSYDQRYFGPAEWQDDAASFSVSTHADDLVAMIDALNAGPVHLVTWSYGGLVGIHAALRNPENFRSIVHFEPSVGSLHAGLSGERAAIAQVSPAFAPMAASLEKGAEAEAVRRLIEAVFQLDTGTADGFPEEAQSMWDENARTLVPFLEASSAVAPITCEDLSGLEMPTLVMQGSDTYVLDAMMADEVARCQPNTSTMVLPGANHGGPALQPEAFIDAVLSFVGSVE